MRTDNDEESCQSWQTKCIAKFNLRPVPPEWAAHVDAGTEPAWRRYFEYRSKIIDASSSSNGGPGDLSEIDSDEGEDFEDEEDLDAKYLQEWKEAMSGRIQDMMHEGCGWPWTPKLETVDWDPYSSFQNRIMSAEYSAHVWSPYAIPHAIALTHSYHKRARWSSMEFGTFWWYRLIDFEREDTIEDDSEDEDEGENDEQDFDLLAMLHGEADETEHSGMKKWTVLCSNQFKDEFLMAEVIDEKNLTQETCDSFRSFLFGAATDNCRTLTCTDKSLWYLIFGSMGTTDLELANDVGEDISKRPIKLAMCDLGWMWRPSDEQRQFLYDQKAQEGRPGEHECDPSKPYDEYWPEGCSWLKYRILKLTNSLGPMSSLYRAPTIKDAYNWSPEWQEEEDSRLAAQATVDEMRNDAERMREFHEADPATALDRMLELFARASGR
ncbi:hypothetical protein THAOC_31758 [Thalassiosira oceanica]|uniref:Uncharacterized protein n=1 Tax=Thalassiosira oceanica TaxID=159749 RepID=K0R8K5_THAOC|nr:hypothetical protein THAOC_31758 [Thalassiosira oceanica]|eukprot:EJK49370.1 hypothetical protein THAOC_31758 [Thalassiosira oceanica]